MRAFLQAQEHDRVRDLVVGGRRGSDVGLSKFDLLQIDSPAGDAFRGIYTSKAFSESTSDSGPP